MSLTAEDVQIASPSQTSSAIPVPQCLKPFQVVLTNTCIHHVLYLDRLQGTAKGLTIAGSRQSAYTRGRRSRLLLPLFPDHGITQALKSCRSLAARLHLQEYVFSLRIRQLLAHPDMRAVCAALPNLTMVSASYYTSLLIDSAAHAEIALSSAARR